VTAAGLADTLKSPNKDLTLFAPTDAAFAAPGRGAVADLLKPANRERLAKILKRHVLDRRLLLTGWKARTLSGDCLRIRATGPIHVEGATVILADVRTTNGVVHVIDRVLMGGAVPATPAGRAAELIERAVDRGSVLLDAGNAPGCVAIYAAAARSLLSDYGDVLDARARKDLQNALMDMQAEPEHDKQAWILRRALDRVYRRLQEGRRPEGGAQALTRATL